jgi:hypothetical protein
MHSPRPLVQNDNHSRINNFRSSLVSHSLACGLIAAIAALVCYKTNLPLWAMFLGWVVLHTSEVAWRKAIANWVNLLLGLALGMGATLCVEWLVPKVHLLALPFTVFMTTVIIVLVRAARPINNSIATFLGLIAFLACHMNPTFSTLYLLVAATTTGLVAAWIAHLSLLVQHD